MRIRLKTAAGAAGKQGLFAEVVVGRTQAQSFGCPFSQHMGSDSLEIDASQRKTEPGMQKDDLMSLSPCIQLYLKPMLLHEPNRGLFIQDIADLVYQ